MDYRHGTNHPGFQALLRGVGEGRLWSKLSGTYRLGATPPDYAEARPFHDALVAANPNNLVWGTDWPHPRPEGPAPDAARLLKVFLDWTTRDHRQPILVDNPSRLYDLPIIDRTRGTADGRDRSANGDDRRGQKNQDNQQKGKEERAASREITQKSQANRRQADSS
jgi:hypothetical protein